MRRSQTVRLRVNGVKYDVDVEPRTLLVHCLRDILGLTGTHIGCVVGKCGACSVLLNGAVIKSCMLFAVQAEGSEITTIEGLAPDGQLTPVQEAFWEHHGVQCGYCTPGLILASHCLLQEKPAPTEEEIRRGISGNLCTCTGYVNIVKAVQAAAATLRKQRKSRRPR